MMKRMDWHTHILPQIDDGSSSVEESLEMLRVLTASGVDTVALTPHFYPDRSYPDVFLEARKEAFKKLEPHLFEGAPRLLLGAEVSYFDGIRTCDEIRSLTIEHTNCVLIEMPMTTWNERMFDNILRLAKRIEITPIIAHIDRYRLRKSDWGLINYYLDEGGLVQGNSDFFIRRRSERKAMRMFNEGIVQLIGSDCHNMTKRIPTIGNAFDLLDQKADKSVIEENNLLVQSLLK